MKDNKGNGYFTYVTDQLKNIKYKPLIHTIFKSDTLISKG